jgi:acyl-coenzyme A thioesterase 13
MSSRFQNAGSTSTSTSSSSSTLSPLTSNVESHDSSLPPAPHTQPVKVWVDPATTPHYQHDSPIKGNAPDYVKQLNYNTFMYYGVGEEDSFGYNVGKAVKFVEVNVNRKQDRQGRLEATTIAEIVVTKRG